ncbi:zn-finger domain-containing protein [Gigaspora margarita]|uniref:Zn-finger domain-containing protein n=1 Tax=Gigaspora margarita TaxID=4874 RepID=A0A8H4ETT8_GIGMA|nr:zn-finger domain-containing protein [Gigaspora margarita]
MNIYEATVIDRMHHLDLGLFKHQINFTCSLLKEKYEASILDTIDNRLGNIPRFPELKNFKNGIQSLAKITANKYRNLMKVMIFVLNNLVIDKSIQNKLLKLYKDWNNIYFLSWYKEFTDNDLKDFEIFLFYLESNNKLAKQFIKLIKTNSASKLKFSKLHSWVYHTTDLIKKYGCLNGFTIETYESLYKDFVKTPYYLSNKQNIENQIMKMVQRQIYLLIKVETSEKNVNNLALIQWYDFKSTKNQYHYRCSRLLTELYNIVNVEAIKNNVHIILCFDKTNDYLVNKYIF